MYSSKHLKLEHQRTKTVYHCCTRQSQLSLQEIDKIRFIAFYLKYWYNWMLTRKLKTKNQSVIKPFLFVGTGHIKRKMILYVYSTSLQYSTCWLESLVIITFFTVLSLWHICALIFRALMTSLLVNTISQSRASIM